MNKKTEEEPHGPICGAKTRKGTPCKNPSLSNGRCRFHGGKSTGPKTKEGRLRCKLARIKHGYFSKEFRGERKALRELNAVMDKQLLCELPDPTVFMDACINFDTAQRASTWLEREMRRTGLMV